MKNIIKVTPKDRNEWLQIKRGTIGGSEIAAVCGLNKWFSPRDVWMLKTGKTEFAEPAMVMKRGSYLEDGFAQFWANEMGHRIIKSSKKDILYIDKEHRFLSVTPDRTFFHRDGGKRTLEIKTTFSRAEEPEMSWITQLQWEMLFTGHQFGEIVWEYGDPRICFKSQEFEADKTMQQQLKEYAIYWWNEFVVKDIEPPAINSNDILNKFPVEEEGKEIIAPDSIAEKYSYMKQLQVTIKEKEDELEGHKEQVKMFMEDAENLTYNGEKLFTWKANKKGTRVFYIK